MAANFEWIKIMSKLIKLHKKKKEGKQFFLIWEKNGENLKYFKELKGMAALS